MATFEEEWEARFKQLNEQHERGEITYDELVKRGNAGLRKMEQQCGHKRTTTETFKNGASVEWCDSCGAKVSSTSSGQLAAASSGSSCAVLALGLLSAAGAGIWGVIEAALAIFG